MILRVIAMVEASFPAKPCAQSVVPTVITVPLFEYVPITAFPVRPFPSVHTTRNHLGAIWLEQ